MQSRLLMRCLVCAECLHRGWCAQVHSRTKSKTRRDNGPQKHQIALLLEDIFSRIKLLPKRCTRHDRTRKAQTFPDVCKWHHTGVVNNYRKREKKKKKRDQVEPCYRSLSLVRSASVDVVPFDVRPFACPPSLSHSLACFPHKVEGSPVTAVSLGATTGGGNTPSKGEDFKVALSALGEGWLVGDNGNAGEGNEAERPKGKGAAVRVSTEIPCQLQVGLVSHHVAVRAGVVPALL